jgi:hypothetical protein
VSPQLKKKNQEEEPRREESDSRPPVASRDSKRSPAKKTSPARPKPETQIGDSFQQFWRSYPRRVARAAAERAFAAAIADGADPRALIEHAKRYAAERAGEPERYTAYASTWLRGRRWEDEPPGGAVIDETGAIVAIEQPQQAKQPRGYEAVADQLIAEAIASGRDW